MAITVTTTDVADLIAQRVLTQDGEPAGTFDSTTVPTDTQVARLILKVTAEETGGLGTIPTVLEPMAVAVIALATAVRVLGVYFSGSDARDDLDADLDKLRARFRQAVDVIATTGDPTSVSAGDGLEGDRPPPPVFSFPTIEQRPIAVFGVPVTSLTERF